MEAFPANNSTPFELIQKMIDDSDYYILVIGGRYGSLNEEGISYTEMEYDYALKTKKHILSFVHKNQLDIPLGKTDTEKNIIEKLETFKKKISVHLIKYWTNKFDLKSYVLSSLSIAFQLNPQQGWVKLSGDFDSSFLLKYSDLLSKYNDLQDKYLRLQERISIDEINKGEDFKKETTIKFFLGTLSSWSNPKLYRKIYEIKMSWLEVFFGLAHSLLSINYPSIIIKQMSDTLNRILKGTDLYSTIFSENAKNTGFNIVITKETLLKIKVQFISFNWINIEQMLFPINSFQGGPKEEMREVWRLTEFGKKLISENISEISQEIN